MKWILYAVFIFFFVVMPMYLLNAMLMPDVNSLMQTYTNADHIANHAAGVPSTN